MDAQAQRAIRAASGHGGIVENARGVVVTAADGASLARRTRASSVDQVILVGVQMSTLTPGWIFGF